MSIDCRVLVSTSNYTDCSDLVIDGRDAALKGEYPVLNLRTYFKFCNYDNDNWMKLELGKSKAEIYYNTTNGPMNSSNQIKNYIFQDFFPNATRIRYGGHCNEMEGQITLDTARAKYHMEAQLVGKHTDSDTKIAIDNGACYAYAYKKIDFKYDYGQ